ncbi:MAG: helix-turn-helix domain-containing protein [Roseibium sp.]|uniref:helix-turn-helix domain-containing protein n=1 Tax=Roseibium sp. TaxID=1936156 RepID=UPI002609E7FC|nr:helix-turn-helix transcriptional regulator [Roseibium sp.]MCV0428029.1 helix-turn-helix domain-containing protein [Roseibium sp.]
MTRDERKQVYSENLRLMCQRRKSASAVAREIGINRQQFEKYLQGVVLPSAHSQFRIAQYFDVSEEMLLQDGAAADWLSRQSRLAASSRDLNALFGLPSAHELSRLRNYQGIYHVYFVSPAFPGYIHVGVALVRESDFQMTSVFFVRTRHPETGIVHRSHLYGLMWLRGERVFVVERTKRACDRFSETILFPSHGDKMKYMTGMSIGLTWHPQSEPFAARTIWRRAGVSVSLRQAIRGCGLYRVTSPNIDSVVRKFFCDGENLFQGNVLSTSGFGGIRE